LKNVVIYYPDDARTCHDVYAETIAAAINNLNGTPTAYLQATVVENCYSVSNASVVQYVTNWWSILASNPNLITKIDPTAITADSFKDLDNSVWTIDQTTGKAWFK
jgi:hypothetical protein